MILLLHTGNVKEAKLFDDFTMGAVQTAYANGRSTDYIVHTMIRIFES
jgi:hypothetical protein